MGSRARRYYLGKDAVQTEHIVDKAITEAKLADIVYGTVSIDFPSISGGAIGSASIAVSGLTTSHHVFAQFAETPGDTIVIVAADVPVDGTLRVYALNPSAVAIDLGAKVVKYLTIK